MLLLYPYNIKVNKILVEEIVRVEIPQEDSFHTFQYNNEKDCWQICRMGHRLPNE